MKGIVGESVVVLGERIKGEMCCGGWRWKEQSSGGWRFLVWWRVG